LVFQVVSFLRGFPPKLVHFSLLSHACHMPRPPHLPWLDLPNDSWGWVQTMKLLIVTVIKHEEETNNRTVAEKLGVTEPNVQCWRKQKLLQGPNSTQKVFCGPKHENFNAVNEKVLEFVLKT
jgi:hypothetical protein